ncbi:MAG: O-antigen ligase family protein [Crocinitomicaceae bacterium]|jgi:O-antigen ligase
MNASAVESNKYAVWYPRIIGLIAFFALFDLKANAILKLNVLPILILGFLALVITGIVKKQLKFKLKPLAVLLIAFYVLYAIYAIYTRNPHQAGVYLENKLSFLILPLLFSFRPIFTIKKDAIIYGWIGGTLALFLASIVNGVACYLNSEANSSCFISSNFSFQYHPTYASVYYTVSFFLAYYAWKNKVKWFSGWATIAYMTVFFIAVFLCVSLAGMLFFMLALSVAVLLFIKNKWGKKWMIISMIVLPFMLYGIIKGVPRIEGEWSNAVWYAEQYMKEPRTYVEKCKPPHSGTQTRIIMWTVAYHACMHYPLGVGTGNVDEVLATYLRKYNQENMVEYQYNPHNQFLQTWLEIGVLGLLCLIGIIVYLMYIGIQQKNYLIILVALSLAFNCLFESMLQRQSGIFFYPFLFFILEWFSTKINPTDNRLSE